MPSILLIDDEKAIRHWLKEILTDEGYSVDEAQNGEEGLQMLRKQHFDVALCDIKMPKMDGMEMLTKVQEEGIDTQLIMFSAHGSIENAVEATKKGAFDFIPKPPDLNRILVSVRNATDRKALVQETKVLKQKIVMGKGAEIVGESAALAKVREAIQKVAPTEARVMILGPNGVGKELVAKAIHKNSNRSGGPMVVVNCAAIPQELIESELFGHEKGAFTSAVKQHIGKFEQAQKGTLFLDEIGDMSLSAQAKVLRALQESKIARVGGDKEITVDVRVIAATNKDLRKEIEAGRFREDLFHRLSVIIINVPPLKDRKEDIPALVQKFLEDIAQDYGNAPKKMSASALKYLQTLPWTGNIRELRNVVERLVILGGTEISEADAKAYAGYGS